MLDKLKKVYKKPRLIIIDLLLLNFAFSLSFILRFDGFWTDYINISYFLIITAIGIIVLYFSNLYNKMWQYASIAELTSIIKTTILINLIFVIYIYFCRISFPRSIMIINCILDIFFIGGSRFLLRLLRDYLKRDNITAPKQKVLIIGAGDAAEIIVREMHKHPELKKEIIGLIDDDPQKHDLEIHGVKVLGNRYDIPEIINRYAVKEVIIAIPSAKGNDIEEIYDLSNKEGVNVKIAPGVYEILNGDISLSQIREVKVEDLLRRDQVELITDEISAYLENKRVLITGGGGSIGSELCRQVARFNPEHLVVFDINENSTYFLELDLKQKYGNLNITSEIGSIRDKNKLRTTFRRYRPDVVFHAAAHKHVPLMEDNPEEAIKNNVMGTKNVAEVADEFNIDRFVLISTDKAVNPTNIMGATKRVAEMVIQTINEKSNTSYMAVRFGNVLGSEGSVIPIFKKQIASGGPVTVTHPEICRYFMTIPEAAQLVIQAGAIGKGGEVFVLDMGEQVKIIDLAKDLIKLSGLKIGEDINIEITGLRPGEKLYEELLCDTETNIATEHERIYINNLELIDVKELNNNICKLEKLAKISDSHEIVNTLVHLVGTYQPQRDNIGEVEFAYKSIEEQKFKIAVAEE